MQLAESDEQWENADSEIRGSLEPDSNVTAETYQQSEKHLSPSSSADQRMQIDESDEQPENAKHPKRITRLTLSDSTLEMTSLSTEQFEPNSSIPAHRGMTILSESPN
jgi:hypothetical protein